MEHIRKTVERHNIKPRQHNTFLETLKYSKKEDIEKVLMDAHIAYKGEDAKPEEINTKVEELVQLMLTREKWSASRLRDVVKDKSTRKMFILHLAYKGGFSTHRGILWLPQAIRIGHARRGFRGVVDNRKNALAIAELKELGYLKQTFELYS